MPARAKNAPYSEAMIEVGTADGVRARNLSRILRLVHVDGPLPRAALTEATGLNRSTIADLVAELESLDLVEQGEPDRPMRVGRPSPTVAASARAAVIAVHPEVDALEVAAVALDRSILARERITMDHLLTPAETVAMVVERLGRWRRGPLRRARVSGVGVAVPGLVRAGDGVIRDAPHLLWKDVPLREALREATGLPTVVGNDASLGAMAEHRFGAAVGFDDVVYLNGGASGIGGGVVVGGHQVTGSGGYAGEFGQNRPGTASTSDRRARDGVLEDEVSRARLIAAARRGDLDDAELGRAFAEAPSPDLTAEIARQRRVLATALANAVNVLNPAAIVLGGFLALLADVDIDGLEHAVRLQAMAPSGEDLVIRTAALAGDRLLVGAAEAAFEPILSDPSAR